MNKTAVYNMESLNCRSDAEQRDYYKELAEVEKAIKAVKADKKKEVKAVNNRFNPDTNYKLIYR